MVYSKEDVLASYFAYLILNDPYHPGDVARAWQAAVGAGSAPSKGPDTLSAWEEKYQRGLAILAQAQLIFGRPMLANSTSVDIPRHVDSPAVPVHQEMVVYVALAKKAGPGPGVP